MTGTTDAAAERQQPLPLGAKTKFGTVEGIRYEGPSGEPLGLPGERFYLLVKDGVAKLMPADVVEGDAC